MKIVNFKFFIFFLFLPLFILGKNPHKLGGKYAGLEVGAKGVKMSIISMEVKSEDNIQYDVVFDTTANTNFTSFTNLAMNETVVALQSFYQKAREMGVQHKRIYAAISSGVHMQAINLDKEKDLQKLVDNFKTKIKIPINFEVISVEMEAQLSHVGIIGSAARYDAVLLDIGSGNSKGGIFTKSDNRFLSFGVQYGTMSTADYVERKIGANANFKDYLAKLNEVCNDVSVNEIQPVLRTRSSIRNKRNIVVSGGIAWAISNMLYPERVNKAYTEIKYDDIVMFRDLLLQNYDNMLNEDFFLVAVKDPQIKQKAKKEITRVFDTFDQKALLAGTELLLRFMNEFSNTTLEKKYYLARYGHVGWITGYIIQSVVDN